MAHEAVSNCKQLAQYWSNYFTVILIALGLLDFTIFYILRLGDFTILQINKSNKKYNYPLDIVYNYFLNPKWHKSRAKY